MHSFTDYLRVYDPSKVAWAPLWETGERTIRPASVTYDTVSATLPGKHDGAGLWTTGAKSPQIPLVTLRLPAPFDKGIDFDSFSATDAGNCIEALIGSHPWLRAVGGKGALVTKAKATPGVRMLYEASNGYWRSSIYSLVSDYAKYKRTGVDPRAGVAAVAASQHASTGTSGKKHKLNDRDGCDATQTTHKPATGMPVPTAAVGVPVAKKMKTKLAVDPDQFKPPAAHFQIFRYAGECDALEKHIKKRHLFRYATKGHWIAIREWLKSKEGRAYLKDMCGLDPEGVQLDHIRPKDSGELNHMYNCYFMPSSVNAHFKDRWDDEKKRYIGARARTKAGRFMRWHAKQSAELVDVALYKGHML